MVCCLPFFEHIYDITSSLGEQLGRRSPSRLVLEIDIRERLPVVIADDETRGLFLDGPGRREASWASSLFGNDPAYRPGC